MNNEKFGGAPRPNEGEDEAFKKFMEQATAEGSDIPLENVSFEENDDVRLDAANTMIERMKPLSKNFLFTREDDKEAREMIMTLEKLQKHLPNAKKVGVALTQLRNFRNRFHEETV